MTYELARASSQHSKKIVSRSDPGTTVHPHPKTTLTKAIAAMIPHKDDPAAVADFS